MADRWALNDILRYFQEDPEVKEELSKNEFSSMMNPNEEFLKLLKVALEFQGFDPRVIMRQLIRNRKAYGLMGKEKMVWDLSNVGDDFRVGLNPVASSLFSNKEPLSKDLEFLIIMFLLRNNHISKIINKSINGLDSILSMLKEKYEINDEVRASGTAIGSKDITLPRIARVLPSVAVRMFHMQVVKEIIPFLSIPGVRPDLTQAKEAKASDSNATESMDITHAICCPFFPLLHPRSTSNRSHLHALMLYVAVRLDDTIHKKGKNPTPLSDLMTYYKAGFDSAATPETSRVEVCRKVGILQKDSISFVPVAIAINKKCFIALKEMRTEDPFYLELFKMGKVVSGYGGRSGR